MPGKLRLYNLDRLYEIDGTSKEFIREVINAFLKSMPIHARDLVVAANEKKWDKVGEMVGMEMGKQNVCDAVAIDTGLNQVGEGAGPEVEEERVIGFNQIPGSGPSGMHICS